MDALETMKSRHSVRQYKDLPVEEDKRKTLNELIEKLNRENGLHIQVFYDEPDCFNSMMAHYGKFSGVKNYISLVGKKSPDPSEKLGYFGEQLVLKAAELGFSSCWVAMTHGKSKAAIGKGEKEVCLIAFGYGCTNGAAHKSKPLSELCGKSGAGTAFPDWFSRGMEAALLAPTAMNQQKFYFELLSGEKVKATCGKGFYTKLDLGIVKYHFELGAGKKPEYVK